MIFYNGPCYDKKNFPGFAQKYNHKHASSLPHYQKNNGLTEKHIGIRKNWVQRALEVEEDPNESLLIYRTIILNSNMACPLELLNRLPQSPHQEYKEFNDM